ncbi:hypothetical protein R9B83_01180 [Metamycoplasma equirhinis]|uniref:Uncharacterized protein n=1 Tax=Metamycoplasma equirhinis TaxID=92402 RepID=A0ABZ0PBJ6_9BACT|nr:hypothetical protein [Metamycoplasma equirhinis]TPD97785.1 hypothetical protein FJM08_02890 [Metamycoplasma equirhinis]WPB54166.1 hypothetical protein R9B83_01180 [Metamycoplasma equirhinis]
MNRKFKALLIELPILISLLGILTLMILAKWVTNFCMLISLKCEAIIFPDTVIASLSFVFVVFIFFVSLYVFLELLIFPNFRKFKTIILSLSIVVLISYFSSLGIAAISNIKTYEMVWTIYGAIILSILFGFISTCAILLKKINHANKIPDLLVA